MDAKIKKQIDKMSYEQMLRTWRFAPCSNKNSMFIGEVGDYFSKSMAEKECKLKPGEKSKISKRIG